MMNLIFSLNLLFKFKIWSFILKQCSVTLFLEKGKKILGGKKSLKKNKNLPFFENISSQEED